MNNIAKWTIFGFVLTLFLYSESLTLFWLAEGGRKAALILVYLISISVIWLTFISLLSLVSTVAWRILFSAYVGLSLLVLKLLFFEFFTGLAVGWLILAAVAAAVGVFFYVDKKRVPTPSLYFICMSIFVLLPVSLIFFDVFHARDESTLTREENQFLDQLSNIEFKDRPNIYYLSYDSLVPPRSAEKFLGLTELEYDALIRDEFHVLEPSVAIFVPTKPSLNTTMRLDQKNLSNSYGYFNGEKPSAVSAIFSNNGYEITTGYQSYHLGQKGPFIDRYVVNERVAVSKTVLCISEGHSTVHRLRSFGACKFLGDFSGIDDLSALIFKGERLKRGSLHDWHRILNEEIKIAARKSRPQFIAIHTFRPIGHTRLDYKHSDIRQREDFRKYFESGDELLAGLLRNQVELIRDVDPGSIVIVAGDHGLLVSRGMQESEDLDFVIEDKHLIYTAVLKSTHECSARRKLSKFSKDFYTPGRVIASVVSCLSEDVDIEKLFHFEESKEISDVLNKVR